jgi:predicted AlkP superfamily phosphohydrolase/phosphomutase
VGKLLVIGLDGATFDLIKPWVEEGKLPHLASLLAQGTHGNLRSTVPAMSPPAWTSFVTGKNPGKHGIFDFTARKPGSYEIEFINGRWRKAPTMWRLMSDAGKRVCVVAVPISYPPEPVNGAMISGIDTPGATGGVADPSAFHPAELHAEINHAVGPYLISPNLVAYDDSQCDAMVEAALQTMERKVATAQYLFAKESWDCFMLVLGETDGIAHRLWKYHDKRSPLADERVTNYRGEDPLLRIYRSVDQHIGSFCRMLPDDTTLIVMSDHGQGGNGAKAVYLNHWLAEQGLLRFKMDTKSTGVPALVRRAMAKQVQWAKTLGMKCLPPTLKRKLLRKTQLANKMESWLRFSHLDWHHTQAYSEETPYFPSIWINVRGREPMGIVQPGAEYEQVREQLIETLSRWQDPDTGQRVIKKVHKREALYTGPFVDYFPDLIIEWGLDQGNSYLFKSSRGTNDRRVSIVRLEGKDREQAKSGDHRDAGICLVAGRQIQRGMQLEGAQLMDLAPTMLYLLGLPVPKDMDGKVLTQLFQPEYLAANRVRYGEATTAEQSGVDQQQAYSQEEEEAIKARLQGLGYLE